MKILTLTFLFATAIGLASCNKQYNSTVSDSQTGGNNGGNSNNDFNWTGTAPLSVKANGTFYLGTSVDITTAFGYYYIMGESADGTTIFGPSVPVGAEEGKIYSMPSPANVTWQFDAGSGSIALGAGKGKCKIVTNNATTIEGYFWADTKDYSGLHDTTVALTEGYFKVDK